MLREARTPKVHDWLVNYVVKSPHSKRCVWPGATIRIQWSRVPAGR